MAAKSERVRRRLGVFFLAGAVLLLIAGETVLGDHLRSHPWEFLVFWMFCFIFVSLALLIAIVDMVVVRRRVRREERELLESTLGEITGAKDLKTRKPPEKSIK